MHRETKYNSRSNPVPMSSDFSMVLRFWIDRDFIFRVDEQRKKERGSGDFRIQVICIRSSMWGGWAEVGRGDGWKSILIRQSRHLPVPFFPLQLLRFAYTVGVRIWFLLCMYTIQIRLSSSSPPHAQYHSLACRLLPGILGSSPSTPPRPQKNFYSFF